MRQIFFFSCIPPHKYRSPFQANMVCPVRGPGDDPPDQLEAWSIFDRQCRIATHHRRRGHSNSRNSHTRHARRFYSPLDTMHEIEAEAVSSWRAVENSSKRKWFRRSPLDRTWCLLRVGCQFGSVFLCHHYWRGLIGIAGERRDTFPHSPLLLRYRTSSLLAFAALISKGVVSSVHLRLLVGKPSTCVVEFEWTSPEQRSIVQTQLCVNVIIFETDILILFHSKLLAGKKWN